MCASTPFFPQEEPWSWSLAPTCSAQRWREELRPMPAFYFRPHALLHDCFVFCHPRGTRERGAPSVLRDRWATWRFGSVSAAGAEF